MQRWIGGAMVTAALCLVAFLAGLYVQAGIDEAHLAIDGELVAACNDLAAAAERVVAAGSQLVRPPAVVADVVHVGP